MCKDFLAKLIAELDAGKVDYESAIEKWNDCFGRIPSTRLLDKRAKALSGKRTWPIPKKEAVVIAMSMGRLHSALLSQEPDKARREAVELFRDTRISDY